MLSWLIFFLLVLSGTKSKNCLIEEIGYLATDKGKIIWQTPLHLELIETQLKALKKEVGYKHEDSEKHNVQMDGKAFTLYVPVSSTDSITLSRGKCIEIHAHSASAENILKSRINEKYDTLTSISFVMKTNKGVKCNVFGKESESDCWKQVENLGKKYNMETNISNMVDFLNKHELGLLNTKPGKLFLTTGVGSKLPCIKDQEDKKPETKWKLLRDNYLKPKTLKAEKILKRIKQAAKGRSKRSLFSSIFGLASAAETQTLREALKVELNNQKSTNKAMTSLLRNQIKTAKQIKKEDQVLFNIGKHELELENEVSSLKEFLENAFSNTSEISTRQHQDILTILKTFTLSERLQTLEQQLATILDIIHCPSGKCKRILEEVMEEENIGDSDTFNLIANLVKSRYSKERIEVEMRNITKESKVINIRCIPSLDKTTNKTIKLDYNHNFAVNKQRNRFYKLPKTCIRTLEIFFCPEQQMYSKDKCLEHLLNKEPTEGECNQRQKEDQTTKQDLIADKTSFNIYTRERDMIRIKMADFEEKAELKEGINTFNVERDEYEVQTSEIYMKVNNHKNKDLASETIFISKFDPKYEDSITEKEGMKMDMRKLKHTKIATMNLGENLQFELSNVEIPHPALVFFSTPEDSWYIYALFGVVPTITVALVIGYCKCKKKCCFRHKHRKIKKSESKTRESTESESEEEETKLMFQTPKYSEMVLQNLGFCKEIVSEQSGKKYFWNGSSWRDINNKVAPAFREPPSYLIAELKTYSGGCAVGIKNNKPYIHMKNFPETIFNRVTGSWQIFSKEGMARTLPSYASPRPDEETLQKFRKTLVEHTSSSTNL